MPGAPNRRGLPALFCTHLNLYGRFELDMSSHLNLDDAAPPAVPATAAT